MNSYLSVFLIFLLSSFASLASAKYSNLKSIQMFGYGDFTLEKEVRWKATREGQKRSADFQCPATMNLKFFGDTPVTDPSINGNPNQLYVGAISFPNSVGFWVRDRREYGPRGETFLYDWRPEKFVVGIVPTAKNFFNDDLTLVRYQIQRGHSVQSVDLSAKVQVRNSVIRVFISKEYAWETSMVFNLTLKFPSYGNLLVEAHYAGEIIQCQYRR